MRTSASAPSAHGGLPPVDERRNADRWIDWLGTAFGAKAHRADHSIGVWQRIVDLRSRVVGEIGPERLATLELAALLHDIGRAVDPLDREPHGFSGARFLGEIGLDDLAPLVAHHSGTKLEAAARGMDHLDRWPGVDGELVCLLDYADRTTDRFGQPVSLTARRADLVARYGPRSPNVHRFDALLPTVRHTQARLRFGALSRRSGSWCAWGG